VLNLWECLGWSIIGQQVSVASAFAMRARLVRAAGAVVSWKGTAYEGFPTAADLLKLSPEQMRACGLSTGKIDYLRGIAQAIANGTLQEEEIYALPFDEARARLRALRGIGPWSVEYAMMRVVGDPDACPVEDIGLRNAIAREYGLEHQATLAETIEITNHWKPFRAYGTFYLWQTLW
jgi:DNA-3-methyladenine glycosylase II